MPKRSQAVKPPHKQDWKLWEADILVDSCLKHQFVTVFLPNSGETVQSFIHGFDLDAALLLLDGLYPWPPNRLSIDTEFWVQVRCEHGFYNLQVALCELDGARGNELLTVRVKTAQISHNRRWNTRVFFDARKGPVVDLQLPDEALQIAYIANLSRRGALLEVYGKDLKQQLNRQGKLSGLFKFNDYFQLPLEASIKQCRFLRTPCCHTQMRIMFQNLTEDNQARLDTFIHAIASPLSTTDADAAMLSNFAVA